MWHASQGIHHQAILGDLNTMAHGIARFSSKFCTDKMRFWSLGQSEAAFWHRTVFSITDPDTVPEQDHVWQGSQHAESASKSQEPSEAAGVHNSSALPAASSAAGDAAATSQLGANQEAAGAALFPPGLLGQGTNGALLKWGLSTQICQDIINPGNLPGTNTTQVIHQCLTGCFVSAHIVLCRSAYRISC